MAERTDFTLEIIGTERESKVEKEMSREKLPKNRDVETIDEEDDDEIDEVYYEQEDETEPSLWQERLTAIRFLEKLVKLQQSSTEYFAKDSGNKMREQTWDWLVESFEEEEENDNEEGGKEESPEKRKQETTEYKAGPCAKAPGCSSKVVRQRQK